MPKLVEMLPVIWLQVGGTRWRVSVALEVDGDLAGQYVGLAMADDQVLEASPCFRIDDALRSAISRILVHSGALLKPGDEVRRSLEFAAHHGVPQRNR